MPRYCWKAKAVMHGDDEATARADLEDAVHAINKNPDGPRIYLDDDHPEVDDD